MREVIPDASLERSYIESLFYLQNRGVVIRTGSYEETSSECSLECSVGRSIWWLNKRKKVYCEASSAGGSAA